MTHDDDWTHVSIARSAAPVMWVHTTESVDGVLFVATLLYGADGRLEEKHLTRADLVRG